jgi:hypothetical protein
MSTPIRATFTDEEWKIIFTNFVLSMDTSSAAEQSIARVLKHKSQGSARPKSTRQTTLGFMEVEK